MKKVQKSYFKLNKMAISPWLFMAPALIMFCIYVIMPIFESIWISFYQWDGLGEKIFVGINNYIDLIHDDNFYVAIKNNILWLIFYMLAVPAGLFIALFLNQTVLGIRLYKSLFFFHLSSLKLLLD